MMSIATMLLVYGSTTEVGRAVRADTRTRAVLDEARQALIGRAIADANRPGSLPCPDGDNDGSADLFVGSACASYIGRLPWRTLGIGDLRDDAGERLWYALSPAFRDHPSAPPLNSETRGTLTLYSNSSARVVTSQGIAIVFAAGAALAGQRRDNDLAFCATNAKNVQRNRCAANYLDPANDATNASATGPYVTAAGGESYNDRVAVIVAADLMPLVERRIAIEARNALLAYKAASACGCYPWADGGVDGVSDTGVSRGRVPAVTARPDPWPAGTLPAYFAANGWARAIHYTVARGALESAGKGCTTCAGESLSFEGLPGFDVVIGFMTPPSQLANRDRAYPIAAAAAGCAVSARVLIDNVPCSGPGKTVRGACQSASAALSKCRCAAAAGTLVNPPCAAAPGARECEQAMSQLRGCNS